MIASSVEETGSGRLVDVSSQQETWMGLLLQVVFVRTIVVNIKMRGGLENIRRSKLEIICTILGTCAQGANKTKIVYQANLNFKTVKLYLDLRMRKNLINLKSDETSAIYKTTEKGLKLKDDFNNIQLLLR